MKNIPFGRPAYWLAASAVGAAIWVFVADPFPQPAGPESPETEISDVKHLRPRVKQQLARDVISETRTLFEVAALFVALDRVPPQRLEPVDDPVFEPQTSPEERSCEIVIAFVRSRLPQNDLAGKPTVARLEAELCRAKNQPGGLKLPDAASLESTESLLEQARERWHELRRKNEAAEGRRGSRQQQNGR
jgi:hypothetical protein